MPELSGSKIQRSNHIDSNKPGHSFEDINFTKIAELFKTNPSTAKEKLDKIVLETGGPNAVDRYGNTLLHEVARKSGGYHSMSKVAEHLLDKEFDVNRNNGGLTALHYATLWETKNDEKANTLGKKRFDLELIKMLVDRGAGINAKDAVGNTPLLCCLGSPCGNEEKVIDLLIENGADVNVRDCKGRLFVELREKYRRDEERFGKDVVDGGRF